MKIKYKRKNNILLILLYVLIIATGCISKKTNSELIEIQLDNNIKSNIKTSIRSIIKLETNADVLIGEITKMECFDNKIYILDGMYSKTLFLFRIDGKFISKTKLGHGPGEVIAPWTFSIDKKNHNIMLWDQNLSSMLTYDLNLNHLRTQKYDVLIRDFTKMGEDTFLVMSYRLIDKQNKSNLTSYSIYTDNFKKALGHYLPVDVDAETQSTSNPISQFEKTLFIKPWDYNIYEFLNNEVKICYSWNLGKYMFKDSEMNIRNDKKWDKVRNGSRLGPFFNLFESENYLTVASYFKNNITTLLYSKRSKSAIQLNDFFSDRSLPECTIGNIVKNEKDTFIGIVKDRKFGDITSSDNPVLIIFKIVE